MIKTIQKKIKKNEAYLITAPSNIYYLSGFSGSSGVLIITRTHSFLITDFRYKKVSMRIFKPIKAVITNKFFYRMKSDKKK